MTDDEVQQIYDYLHENYEYVGGEFITKKQRGPKQKNSMIGSFVYYDDGYLTYKLHMLVNGMEFDISVKKLIYLYHNKKLPRYVINKDGNIANNRIENLVSSTRDKFSFNNTPRITNSLGIRGVIKCGNKFSTQLSFLGKTIKLGEYLTKEEASEKYIFANNLANQWEGDFDSFKTFLRGNGFGFKRTFPVGVEKCGNRFRSRLRANKSYINLGMYDTPEQAHEAYLKAKQELCKS